MSDSFEPKILAFMCNWCAYAGADLAGVARMQYPANVRLVRLMCSGRMNHGFLLSAFEAGADGVMVSG
jgi:F420-non-reducing hydrogenase iron-sulfur subunit